MSTVRVTLRVEIESPTGEKISAHEITRVCHGGNPLFHSSIVADAEADAITQVLRSVEAVHGRGES